MEHKKKQIFIAIITVTILVISVIGVSFAFFNYTRTGSANTVKVGRIYFNHQEEDSISLENVFPISSEQAQTDTVNAKTLSITVVGDTDYDKGIEYLLTLDSVNNTVNNKKVPINLEVSVTGEGLGTEEQNDYYTNRDNYTESKYKIEYNDKLEQDTHLLVGYISPNTTKGTIEGINGTINIKAYVDQDKVLISDTYPEGTVTIGGVEYYNETPTTNKLVLTTEEWNSITGNNALSFKIKVEAREGIWVTNKPVNACTITTTTLISYDIDKDKCLAYLSWEDMTEEDIDFSNKLCNGQSISPDPDDENYTITMADIYEPEMVDEGVLYNVEYGEGLAPLYNGMEYVNGQYTYRFMQEYSFVNNQYHNKWQDITANGWGVKLTNVNSTDDVNSTMCTSINGRPIVSMSGMFGGSKTKNIDFSSFDTSNVTSMNGMFWSSEVIDLDLSNFDTSKVMDMSYMFFGSNVESIDVSSFDTSNVIDMRYMFATCENLTSLDVSSFDTSNVTDMSFMFSLSRAINLDLSNFNTRNVTNMESMFSSSQTTTIYVSNLWNTDNVTESNYMFSNSAVLGPNGTRPYTSCAMNNDSWTCTGSTGNPIDKTYARIDNPPDSPGYFTYKAAPNN